MIGSGVHSLFFAHLQSVSEWASTALVSPGKGVLAQSRTSKRKAAVKASRSTSSRSKHEPLSSGRRSSAATPLVAGQDPLIMTLFRDHCFNNLFD